MGRTVERLAADAGHDVVLRVDSGDPPLDSRASDADVAIEFAGPEGAASRVREAVGAGLPVVSGSTGWDDGLPAVRELVRKRNGALLHSPNLSVGVALFERIVRRAGHLLDVVPDYRIELEETHHTRKVDHPSGTARWLAEGLVHRVERLERWDGRLATDAAPTGGAPTDGPGPGDPRKDGVLVVRSYREGDIPGTHVVRATGPDDIIELSHRALHRDGFARGAVRAAEWLRGRRGVYTLDDMLDDLLGSDAPDSDPDSP
jgi:4-hydroxy-tetrahydrodipicolinate reductase